MKTGIRLPDSLLYSGPKSVPATKLYLINHPGPLSPYPISKPSLKPLPKSLPNSSIVKHLFLIHIIWGLQVGWSSASSWGSTLGLFMILLILGTWLKEESPSWTCSCGVTMQAKWNSWLTFIITFRVSAWMLCVSFPQTCPWSKQIMDMPDSGEGKPFLPAGKQRKSHDKGRKGCLWLIQVILSSQFYKWERNQYVT